MPAARLWGSCVRVGSCLFVTATHAAQGSRRRLPQACMPYIWAHRKRQERLVAQVMPAQRNPYIAPVPQASRPAAPTLTSVSSVSPITTLGRGTVTLYNPTMVCPGGPCRFRWITTCSPGGPTITKSQWTFTPSMALSVGVGNSSDINLMDGKNYTCTTQFDLTDQVGQSVYSTAHTFYVSAMPGCTWT